MNEFNNAPVVAGCEPTFKPYDSTKTVSLWNKWANDSSGIFGWDVDYYRVDPETNGRDDFLHEYGTLSYSDTKKIKIIVPDNKFPESGFQFNQFDLAMFDAFTISIMKDEFKAKFGVEHRPAEMDMIYICQIDKLYKVEHSQAFREFMNASIYYNLTLVKAANDQSIQNMDEMAGLQDLVENRALENLVGANVAKDTKDVVNRTETTNLLIEKVRKEVYAPVRKTPIENGTNVIATTYYDLSNISQDDVAISYLAHDSKMSSGENRAFTCWFQITKSNNRLVYNLINNQDSEGSGYRIDIINNNLVVNWGTQVIRQRLDLAAYVWYGLVVNINQRQQKVDTYLYQRHTPQIAAFLTTVNNVSSPLTPYEYNAPASNQLSIKGSPMLVTNIRLYEEVLDTTLHINLLNQAIVKDAKLLLMADNALNRLIAPLYKF